MKNSSIALKKLFFSLFAISFLCLLTCCNQENNTTENKIVASNDSTKEVWVELVESRTPLIMPEGWDEEYWNSVNKKVDKQKIFNAIVDAVVSGKKQAYNLGTDSALTIDEVKMMLGSDAGNAGNSKLEKINADDLSMIRMREKWIFDKEKFTLEKKITRIDLTCKKMSEDGTTYVGDKALFYVYLD